MLLLFSLTPDATRLALGQFLVPLAHSTGSLEEIVRLASIATDPQVAQMLPRLEELLRLRNRIVRLPDLENLLRPTQRSSNTSLAFIMNDEADAASKSHGAASISILASGDAIDPRLSEGSSAQQAPFQVPALPWTTITSSDEAVSHLVSVFLTWINPTWRIVEQDLFLIGQCPVVRVTMLDIAMTDNTQGMRSKRLNSDLCSALLVNSICAIGCVCGNVLA
jgi:hypothetical protein